MFITGYLSHCKNEIEHEAMFTLHFLTELNLMNSGNSPVQFC